MGTTTTPYMKEEVQAIYMARYQYRTPVKKLNKEYISSLASSERVQWEEEIWIDKNLVNQHKLNQLKPL